MFEALRKGFILFPYSNTIVQRRKEVYALSKKLPEEDGYRLIQIFDETVKAARDLEKKRMEIDE
ncbi:hypothetical protein ACFFF5_17885 [Lederbergia wuyishanensis]|uniref:Uncharacterized protein n=1 Tax=Lederbergia wuyishanensis TaxID=1347903 RepID=A0ABU0D4H1_9BACI|nr:hypothetical protein [Lederbergia wuyishanensis]MCJ8008102.1 hypothetical protein [Lederbergia wuyishanensis]MDQ0343312.1 hypothetical protein [Lederbergia wuyishanensis]